MPSKLGDSFKHLIGGTAPDVFDTIHQIERVALDDNLYRLLFASASTSMIVVDATGTILDANRQAEATWAMGEKHLLGRALASLFPAGAEAQVQRKFDELFRTGNVPSTKLASGLSMLRRDGVEIPIELTLTPLRGESGPCVVAEIRDLSGETRAENRRLWLSSIVDSSDDAIVAFDMNGCITGWNIGSQRLHGYTAAEAIGRSIEFLLPTDRRGDKDSLLDFARRGKAVMHFETRRQCKHGPDVDVSLTMLPILDTQGAVVGGTTISRDISGRILAERKLHQLNEELERRVQVRTNELEQANSALEQTNHENRMFVYTVSHDLRSPLVNLQGFSRELGLTCQDLRELIVGMGVPEDLRSRALGLIDGDIKQSVDFILNGVARMDRIIDSLLQLSRIGRVAYHMQAVDVATLVDDILASMSSTITERSVRVLVGHLRPCWGDPSFLEQALANLIGNAVKYLDAARAGEIEIGSLSTSQETRRGTVTYFVKDNGLGLSESQLRNLFQPFQRFHPEVASGEGMGLAIVRRIVDRHAGNLRVDSVAGVGSTFFVSIPTPAETTSLPKQA